MKRLLIKLKLFLLYIFVRRSWSYPAKRNNHTYLYLQHGKWINDTI